MPVFIFNVSTNSFGSSAMTIAVKPSPLPAGIILSSEPVPMGGLAVLHREALQTPTAA
jgi:hypothetical protein